MPASSWQYLIGSDRDQERAAPGHRGDEVESGDLDVWAWVFPRAHVDSVVGFRPVPGYRSSVIRRIVGYRLPVANVLPIDDGKVLLLTIGEMEDGLGGNAIYEICGLPGVTRSD